MSRMGCGFGSKKQFLTSHPSFSNNTRAYFADAYGDEQLGIEFQIASHRAATREVALTIAALQNSDAIEAYSELFVAVTGEEVDVGTLRNVCVNTTNQGYLDRCKLRKLCNKRLHGPESPVR